MRTVFSTIAALVLLSLLSGCFANGRQASRLTNECRWNPDSCMYDGKYERDEEDYAEERARDLNHEAAQRVRRRTLWW